MLIQQKKMKTIKDKKRQNAKEIFEMENSKKQHIKSLEKKQKVANFKKQYQKRNEAYEKTIEDTIQMYHEKEQQER